MYAIVATGGKQYKVAAGDRIEVEKLDVEQGGAVALDVVFVSDKDGIVIDAEKLAVAKVFAVVVEHFKGEKQIIFKFKKRKGYKRLRGHRQNLTRLEILEVSLTGIATKASEPKASAAKDDDADKKSVRKVAAKSESDADLVETVDESDLVTETEVLAEGESSPEADTATESEDVEGEAATGDEQDDDEEHDEAQDENKA